MKTKAITAILLVTVITTGLFAQKTPPSPGVGLTIYNDNFGVIRERRQMDFAEGLNTVKFTDVASAIDPTSVKFSCLTSPGAIQILEQNYEFDLVDTFALLKRYIDKEVSIKIKGSGSDPTKTATGILAAYIGRDIILKTGDEMNIISDSSVEAIWLSKAPDDLVTKPTLVWFAKSDVAGSQLVEVTYSTEQISWKADYSAILSPNDDKIDLSGWVTIDNKSGASYKDAAIKLMAGDVRRIREPQFDKMYKAGMVMSSMEERAPSFEEKAFAEYHLYTLTRPSTINNNQIKQIELITPASNIPATKLFIFDRQMNPKKIQVKIEFENLTENGLGIAMPKGKIRVFKRDSADDTLEFIGEDSIDHTPNKEKLSLYIGDAFDIVPEYKMLDSQLGPNSGEYRWRKEKHQVEIRNRKNEAITVFVDEKFTPWMNWTIDESTHTYEKKDAFTARFKVEIKADSTEKLIYSTTQTW
jgi:hypothetical protein